MTGQKYRTIDIQKEIEPYGLKTVPIIETDVLLKDTIDEMVEYSQDKSKLLKIEREGIVCRDIDNKISFKVINPKFLLKNDE